MQVAAQAHCSGHYTALAAQAPIARPVGALASASMPAESASPLAAYACHASNQRRREVSGQTG